MIPDFDSNGNLPPGLIPTSIKELKKHCVLDFGESSTRNEIFNGYTKYCREMIVLEVAIKQWLGGSFITNKINPNDIDFVTHIDGNKADELDEMGQQIFINLHDRKKTKSEYLCDVFDPILVYPEEQSDLFEFAVNQMKFWLKYLGRDRNKNLKGIIDVDLAANISDIVNYRDEDGA
jgi:hypothetical protein